MQSFKVPQILYDANLNWGQDLSLSPTGDLLLSSTSVRGEQRVLRRLLTNPTDYIWHPSYGAGLPNTIGQSLSIDEFDNIKSLITSQIFLEPAVSQTPPPQIFLQTIQFGLFCQIEYTDNPSQQAIVLTFDVAA
jgi:hypothetical protein